MKHATIGLLLSAGIALAPLTWADPPQLPLPTTPDAGLSDFDRCMTLNGCTNARKP